MIRFLLGVLLAIWLAACAGTPPPREAAYWDEARIESVIGDTPAVLLLGPSPHFYSAILEFIHTASNTLDVCVYNMDLPVVARELLAAHERGVQVRVVMPPSDHSSRGGFAGMAARMEQLGILHYSNNRSGLMHNKFMIADQRRVWTSSANLTRTCRLLNDNHALIIEHPFLAINYGVEMQEILEGLHGRTRGYPTPFPEIDLGGVTLYSYFLPEDDFKTGMLREIAAASNRIDILAFSFTNKKMCQALEERARAGVRIRILLDSGLARHPASRKGWFKERDIEVRSSPNEAQMHHKMAIVDAHTLIIGSANFSDAALYRNDENMLIFRHEPFARALVREFDRCWLARGYMFNKWNNRIK